MKAGLKTRDDRWRTFRVAGCFDDDDFGLIIWCGTGRFCRLGSCMRRGLWTGVGDGLGSSGTISIYGCMGWNVALWVRMTCIVDSR